MDVAILYSGGKDSNYAVQFAEEQGWNINYLLSIKPSRTDCFLYHYATVEHTPVQAEVLGYDHHLLHCDVADPDEEARIVRDFVDDNPVDAVVLGGTGLQETQLKAVQDAVMPLGVEAFAAHAGYDHDKIIEDMIDDGYEFIIAQYASDGLGEEWLGKTVDDGNFDTLKHLSNKYGFHIGGEGGYFDTFVLDGPTFAQRLQAKGVTTELESEHAGHVEIDEIVKRRKVQV